MRRRVLGHVIDNKINKSSRLAQGRRSIVSGSKYRGEFGPTSRTLFHSHTDHCSIQNHPTATGQPDSQQYNGIFPRNSI